MASTTTGLQDQFAQRQKESADRIGNLYDQQYNASAASLRSTYDRNLSNLQAEQQKIAPQFQTQANNMATDYERQRRNMNLNAMNSGLNTGTSMQQQDAMNRMFQNNYAGLRAQEAEAHTAAGQKMADLNADYRQQLNDARAKAENSKASALIDNTNKQNDWYENQAKLLAGYGDFSAYEKLYGTEAANQMRDVWIIQNPEVALGAGLIDAARYKEITGHKAGTK